MAADPKRILIVAGDADGNLGDRAILQAMTQELRSQYRDIQIAAVAGGPAADGAGVDRIARGMRGFPRLLHTALRSDAILCGGGGLFQDDDSLVKMPYWALRLLLLRLCCRRVIGYSLGVGPLSASSSRLAARLAFRMMYKVSVRDPIARLTAQALTDKDVTVVPDPASVLNPASPDASRRWLEDRGVPFDDRPLIGVAVRRWFPPKPRLIPNKLSPRRLSGTAMLNAGSIRMCELLAKVLDRLVVERHAHILFLPTYNVRHEGDARLCTEVQNRMQSNSGTVASVTDAQLYMGICSHLALMLGGRMHPTLLASAVGTPVVGLSYNPKFQGAFSMRGRSSRTARCNRSCALRRRRWRRRSRQRRKRARAARTRR